MRLILSLFFLLCSNILYGQYLVEGRVLDTQNNPLMNATIVFSSQADSAMVAFGITNHDGKYRIEIEEQGDYFAQVNFMGYVPAYKSLTTDWKKRTIQMESIQLTENNFELLEVELEDEHIPMGIVGDTIVYRADAFKVADDAVVEDLLKQLPGIEVERDGTIKAQGKEVQNLLVDGKEFFGKDPKIATKNLDAEAVETVEVFDKKSEIAEFTGVDDGEEEKTINLTLKEGHKNGGFGRAEFRVGTDHTVFGKLNFNRFSPTTQSSIVANGNNINEQAFSFEEFIDFMGGFNNLISFGEFDGGGMFGDAQSQEDAEGFHEDYSVGANFNHDFTDKLSLNLNYFFLNKDVDLEKTIDSRAFDTETAYDSFEKINSDFKRQNHRLNSKLKWKKNPFSEFILSNKIRLLSSETDYQSNTDYSSTEQDLSATGSNRFSSDDQFNWYSSLSWKKKYDKKGRNWISSLDLKRVFSENKHEIDNIRFGEPLNQYQDFPTNQENFNLTSTYTEPIAKKWYLSLNLEYIQDLTRPERNFYDIIDGERIPNELLTGSYKRQLDYQNVRLSFRRNTKKTNLSFGLQKSQFKLLTKNLERDFDYLLPNAQYRIKLNGQQNMRLSYITNTTEPSLSQLIDLPNLNNPNEVFEGNPNLNPEYAHRFSLNYDLYDAFSNTSLFMGVNYSRVADRIVNQTTINPDFTLSSVPMNSDFYESAGLHFNFARPLRALRLKYAFNASISYSNYNNIINDETVRNKQQNTYLGLRIDNMKKEKLDAAIGVRVNLTNNENGLNNSINQSFSNYDGYIDCSYQFTKSFSWNVNYSLRRYSDEFFSKEQFLNLVNMSLNKSFKEGLWTAGIIAVDLLNENIGLRRSTSINSLREIKFNTRSQYFMFKVTRKLGKKQKKNSFSTED